MFARIKTNGATDIAIYIPAEGSEKSLPALVNMLEKNCVFVQDNYSELKTVKPDITITLGNDLELNRGYSSEESIKFTVPESGFVLDGFVHATPDAFISNAKRAASLEKRITDLLTENSYLKSQIAKLEERENCDA